MRRDNTVPKSVAKKNDRNHRDRGKEPHLLLGFLKAFLIAHDHEGVSLPLRAERKDGRRFGHLRVSFGKGFIALGNRLHAGIRIVAVDLHRERHANGSALVEHLNQGVIYIGQIFAGKRRFRLLKGVFDRQGADDRHAGNQQNEGVGDTTLEPDWVGVAREKHCETSGGRGAGNFGLRSLLRVRFQF